MYLNYGGLNLGAMNELVGGWDSELPKIKLYAKMYVYIRYVHFPEERVHSHYQIPKEVCHPERVKNHCPKLIKTPLGV